MRIEIDTKLPDSWILTTIDEIAEYVQRGKSPKYTDWSELPVINQKCIRWHGIDSEYLKFIHPEQWEKWSKERFLQEGDILWNSTGTGTIGRAAIFKGLPKHNKAVVDSHVTIVRTKNYNQKLLQYWIMSPAIQFKIDGMYTGSTNQVELSKTEVLSTSLPLPPLNEQKRIVAKIEALQTRSTAVKEELEAIKPLLDQFRQSVLAAAFRGDLTKDWREQNPDVEPAEVLLERIRVERRCRWEEAELEKMKAKGKVPKDDKWKKKYKEPEPIHTEGLPELPDGWCWVSVEHFADVGTGATPLRKNTKYYDGGTIPWVTSGALNEIFIETVEEYITPLAIEETNAKVFPKHTLLVAMYGEGKTRGKVSELLIEAATNQACAALILNGVARKIRPIVKLFFLKNYSDIRRIASGGVQPNLNLGMIKSTLVPLPPLSEQRAICALVEQCMLAADSTEQKYQQAEVDLETLNQSILAKAFRGELVPQDPNDEPASVLLERIREDRDKQKAAAKKSKTKKKRNSKKQDKQLGIPGM